MLSLPINEVHVWQAHLDFESLHETERLGALSPDEQARSARFRFDKDRHLYVIGRSMMRALLGEYLGCEPRRIRFSYSPYGKPELLDIQNDLQFNLSHSKERILLALSRGGKIGVDIEFMRASAMEGGVARQVFSTQELAVFEALPEDLRLNGFFNGWTRKEAFIKAKGEGLSMPLNQFDVSLHPLEPARLLATRPDPLELERWSLRALELGDGYAGAVAVEKQNWLLKLFTWPNSAGIR